MLWARGSGFQSQPPRANGIGKGLSSLSLVPALWSPLKWISGAPLSAQEPAELPVSQGCELGARCFRGQLVQAPYILR